MHRLARVWCQHRYIAVWQRLRPRALASSSSSSFPPHHPSLFSHNYTTTATSTEPATQQSAVKHPEELWNEYLEKSRIYPDQVERQDYERLRAALWKQRSWTTEDRVLQVLSDMKAQGHEWTRLEYNEYFMVKLHQAKYQEILSTYRTEFLAKNLQLSTATFNVLLATYLQLGRRDEAVQLIREADENGLTPDIRDFAKTINRCIPASTSLQETAKKLIAEHAFDNIGALNRNLIHLFHQRSLDDVRWIYQQQKKEGKPLDVRTYGVLIKGFLDARSLREAASIYQDMMEANVKPNTFVCVSMLSMYAHRRDAKAAEEIVRQTLDAGHKLDELVYNQLIRVYFKARMPRKAFQAFQLLQKDPTLKVNEVIVNTMINGLVINKEIEAALVFYKEMLKSKIKPDRITFNTLLKGYMASGRFSEAEPILREMKKHDIMPDTVTYTTLMEGIFQHKQPESADQMLTFMQEAGMEPNVYTFNALINMWIEHGKMDQAERTLQVAKEAPYHIRPTVHTYTNLIQGYANAMHLPKVVETFQQMLRAKIKPDRATYHFAISAFVGNGQLDDAVACLTRMRGENINATKDTWILLMNECIRQKNWQLGARVVAELEDSGFQIMSSPVERAYMTIKRRLR